MTPFTIGLLSKQTGCNIETIRYYERVGVLPKPPRSSGGHRLYEKIHAKRLKFVRRARELGFSLNEIKDLLHLVDTDEVSCEEVKKITLQHVNEVRSKISDLKRIENVLVDMAAHCDNGEVPECPIIETLFREQQNH